MGKSANRVNETKARIRLRIELSDCVNPEGAQLFLQQQINPMYYRRNHTGTAARGCAALRRQNFVCRFLSRADAIRHSNSAVTVAGQSQPRQLLPQPLNARHPFQMANVVLRHRSLPSIDAREKRFRAQLENFAKLLSDQAQDFIIREWQHLSVPTAPQEAAQ